MLSTRPSAIVAPESNRGTERSDAHSIRRQHQWQSRCLLIMRTSGARSYGWRPSAISTARGGHEAGVTVLDGEACEVLGVGIAR
jgi:hypothetical protein